MTAFSVPRGRPSHSRITSSTGRSRRPLAVASSKVSRVASRKSSRTFHALGGGSTKSISTPILIGATCVAIPMTLPLRAPALRTAVLTGGSKCLHLSGDPVPPSRGRERTDGEQGAGRGRVHGELVDPVHLHDPLRQIGERLVQLRGVRGARVRAPGGVGDRLQRRLVDLEEVAAAAGTAGDTARDQD